MPLIVGGRLKRPEATAHLFSTALVVVNVNVSRELSKDGDNGLDDIDEVGGGREGMD